MKKSHIVMIVSVLAIAVIAYLLFWKKKPEPKQTVKIITPPAGTALPAGESNFTIDRVSPKDYYESVSNSGWKPFGY